MRPASRGIDTSIQEAMVGCVVGDALLRKLVEEAPSCNLLSLRQMAFHHLVVADGISQIQILGHAEIVDGLVEIIALNACIQ